MTSAENGLLGGSGCRPKFASFLGLHPNCCRLAVHYVSNGCEVEPGNEAANEAGNEPGNEAVKWSLGMRLGETHCTGKQF